jgi:hypothetical protein
MSRKAVTPLMCSMCSNQHRKPNEPLVQLQAAQGNRLLCPRDLRLVAIGGALASATVLTVGSAMYWFTARIEDVCVACKSRDTLRQKLLALARSTGCAVLVSVRN